MDRRQFLQSFGLVLAAEPLYRALAALPQGALAPSAQAQARDPAMHAIARLTFGVTPDLYTHVQSIGAQAFVEEQLQPEAIDDSASDQMLTAFDQVLSQNGGVLAKEYGGMRTVVSGALLGAWATRALYSQRQLYERMVHFFSNHFYLYVGKGPVLYLKIDDDRDAMRPNAMTTFRKLLDASAHSPAMLVFLDNAESQRAAPNENYARELMELHTLSVNGGYTEQDVKEVARCLTGWSVTTPRETADSSIVFKFRRLFHDNDAKVVLGTQIPAGGGEQDTATVLDLLAQHPSTAQFISTKIARRFVSDDSPADLVAQLASAFQQTGGDVRGVLRVLFASDDFWNAPPKLKQPFEYVMSVLRALNFDILNNRHFLRSLADPLEAMGNVPFTSWQSPNGFPDVADQWSDALLTRWNVALAAVNDSIAGAKMNFDPVLQLMQAQKVALNLGDMLAFMGQYLLGRSLTSDEQSIVVDFAQSSSDTLQAQLGAGIGLLLASPAFQYR